MKHFLTYMLTISFISSCYVFYASEEDTRYEVNEYNESRDSQLCTKLEREKNIMLGYKIGSAVEGSHAQCVLVAKTAMDVNYVGCTSFFVNKYTIDAIQENDGYIDMLLVDAKTKQKGINLLLTIAAGHLEQHLHAKRAAVLFLDKNKSITDKGYIAVQKTGFIAQPQTEFEKEHNLIRYEKPFKN